MSLVDLYRRTGADLPFGDPLTSHGCEMEGWFWRVTDAASGRVAVALFSINRHPDGDWSTVADAALAALVHDGPRAHLGTVSGKKDTGFELDFLVTRIDRSEVDRPQDCLQHQRGLKEREPVPQTPVRSPAEWDEAVHVGASAEEAFRRERVRVVVELVSAVDGLDHRCNQHIGGEVVSAQGYRSPGNPWHRGYRRSQTQGFIDDGLHIDG